MYKNIINYTKHNNQYYCLVASLPMDIVDAPAAADDDLTILLDAKNEIVNQLNEDDKKLVKLIDYQSDLVNVFNVIDNNELPFNQLANLSLDEIKLEIEKPESLGEKYISLLPLQLESILDRFTGKIDPELLDDDFAKIETSKELQIIMLEQYYTMLEQAGSKMLENWAKIALVLGNVIVAYDARDNHDNIDYIVGANREIIQIIKNNYKANDFGLTNEIDYVDSILNVVATKNVVERERKLDLLKMELLNVITEQEYFSTDYVLACVLKINMKCRWAMLNDSADKEKFKNIVKSFTEKLDL